MVLLVLDLVTPQKLAEAVGVGAEEIKSICKSLKVPIQKRGSVEFISQKLFTKHFESGKPKRVLSQSHLAKMQNARKKKGGK